ncbi:MULTISPECIES: DNA-directed RNA polymerase subunit delta [Paenibacillus]|uniref:Probable DNA-directed RNA polymerase subunit delta n=3 Tax=Paenibacillus TaxID=44249 RepID=A0A1C3CLA3_PAEPO|nr:MULTISPECIES: DNA-directed RNA polymerase subunit delta [Paenibacillus]KAF6625469.1 DNA-directed RNA polymerase subunit delta [Paenibacillus sp. EKM208P]MBP1174056.1 DNA-directed RNA polymerase subunit delta [Paenibacillus sp. PvR133]MCF2716798.1 DNA-directed RNA polymerase subunit delta [Paenibacillus sp. UKAQ_18]MCP3748000.1 DNA-directed RNA polymerase subunit delta [Paenibacillus sp. A3M_27_13]MCP3797397.1 DNA-directed RNA polymerase subunit delta [Paenibacillus sp. CH40]MCP3810546.1 DN
MSTPLNLKIDPEKVHETPMVDLAFMVLKAANTPYYYRDLMKEVAKLRGFSDEEINDVIAQLYTEINIDGRFACVGTNLWGLKRWYPVDKSEDALTGAKRPRIINDEDDDDEDDYHEEEETYNSDDDFDADSEDEDGEDELFDGEEDDDDSDEDVVIDDEDLSDEEDSEDENDDESTEDDDSLR